MGGGMLTHVKPKSRLPVQEPLEVLMHKTLPRGDEVILFVHEGTPCVAVMREIALNELSKVLVRVVADSRQFFDLAGQSDEQV